MTSLLAHSEYFWRTATQKYRQLGWSLVDLCSYSAAMKIVFHADRCQGHQMCAIAAPLLFGSDDYGNATVLESGELDPEQLVAARRAAGNCPENAIAVE